MKKKNEREFSRTPNTILYSLFFIVGGSALVAFQPSATAAIPKKSLAESARPSVQATKLALSLPLQNRVTAIRDQGPEGYKNLIEIMQDEKAGMNLRWRAVTAAGRVGGQDSLPELKKALQSPEWYMRSSGLVALTHVAPEEAKIWARKLLSDKALVVRAGAVDVIAQLGDREASQLLWQKLYARENFKGQQSLFIRRRIVEVLAKLDAEKVEKSYVEVLADRDETLHPVAIQALEKMTKQKLGKEREPIKFKRAYWQQWWKKKQTL